MSEDIPIFVIGNDEKDKSPRIEVGDTVIHLDSGKEYTVESTGKDSPLLMIETENEEFYLVGLDGYLVNDRFEKMEHPKQ